MNDEQVSNEEFEQQWHSYIDGLTGLRWTSDRESSEQVQRHIDGLHKLATTIAKQRKVKP